MNCRCKKGARQEKTVTIRLILDGIESRVKEPVSKRNVSKRNQNREARKSLQSSVSVIVRFSSEIMERWIFFSSGFPFLQHNTKAIWIAASLCNGRASKGVTRTRWPISHNIKQHVKNKHDIQGISLYICFSLFNNKGNEKEIHVQLQQRNKILRNK